MALKRCSMHLLVDYLCPRWQSGVQFLLCMVSDAYKNKKGVARHGLKVRKDYVLTY